VGLVYLFVTLFALTGISWNAVYLTMAAEYPGKDAAGIATGIVFLISTLGIAIGPPLFGYLVDLTGAYTLSWLFVGLCMAMVALLSTIQRRERTTDE
jgi:predicted MFS family arabinose efflux permease